MSKIGETIRKIREKKGYTQAETVKKLNISLRTYQSIEYGSDAKINTIIKILELFDYQIVIEPSDNKLKINT